MDRRTTLKWVLAAAASHSLLGDYAWGGTYSRREDDLDRAMTGYGSDPNLLKEYKAGDLWPLTFTQDHYRLATVLSDLIIPADAVSRSASQVGVVHFLDEWISAPYEPQQQDRKLILAGFRWLTEESTRRFSRPFDAIDVRKQREICDDICNLPKALPALRWAARFFARYRDLTLGGFYTTPVGRSDLQYVGNTPLARFEGPPIELLKRLGLNSSNS